MHTCPMHPDVRREGPGRCPKCGMALVPAGVSHMKERRDKGAESEAHAGHVTESFLNKFWLTLVLTIPILAYSEIFMLATGIAPPRFAGLDYALLTLGSFIFFYSGWVFLRGAYLELRGRMPGMMTLIALAISAAYLFSVFQVLRGEQETLLWELSTLIAIMLLGHWIEMRSVQRAQGALKELAKLIPENAEVVRDGTTEVVSVSQLAAGDTVLVKPGATIPADGEVISGASEVNESIVTGESRPVRKEAGSEVIAGSLNGDGSLTVRITKIGEETFLAGVMRLVSQAEASKSRLQVLSDRAAFALTLIAIIAGGATFGLWIAAGAGIAFSIERLVAVLVVACPHALGLAVPLVAAISSTMAAQNGFLVKRRIALEIARGVNVVLFDKTGTLTKGEFGVAHVMPVQTGDEETVIRLAGSVDAHSEHALARAIVAHAREKGIDLVPVTTFERLPGLGAIGMVDGLPIVVGSEALLKERGIAPARSFETMAAQLSKEGKTVIYVISNETLVGAIALADIMRPESKAAVDELKNMGASVAMITGDSGDVAAWVARELGIERYFARVMPGEKAEKVKLLQAEGLKVAMVGDGVNDAPALTQADLGIAIGAGTNVAIESAGIILARNDPQDIPKIIRLSRLTYSKMQQNLFWATGYNVVAIPLAAGALSAYGIMLQPAVAAILMSLSTVIVAFNALLLRRRSLVVR